MQKQSSDPRPVSEHSDDALLERLFAIQQDVRELLSQYQIKPDSILGMAYRARKVISNSDIRANLLEMLIELQELGGEAKKRGVLDEAAMTTSGKLSKEASSASEKRRGSTSPPRREEIVPASRAESAQDEDDGIDEVASSAFFKRLDDRS